MFSIELSPLQIPKQKPNSQFLGGKIQIGCIVRSFYKAVWATFNPRDKSQEVIIYVEEATWKPDYQLKQPFRNKRAYIYSLYTASQRVEINFDETFLFHNALLSGHMFMKHFPRIQEFDKYLVKAEAQK